jgi:hypothetical protein
VAVLGSDGSGKSTLSAELERRFAARGRATAHVYFGSGDGPSSLLRWPLRRARRVLLGAKGGSERKGAMERRHPQTLGTARAVWALTLAQEKRAKLRRAGRARRGGVLVICDRYPQVEFPGANDGPLLTAWSSAPSRLRRALAAWESRPYQLAHHTPPDLVLRLHIDQPTAERRRPDHDPSYLRRRREMVPQLRFPGARLGVVELDANRDYPEVVEAAERAIEGDGRP